MLPRCHFDIEPSHFSKMLSKELGCFWYIQPNAEIRGSFSFFNTNSRTGIFRLHIIWFCVRKSVQWFVDLLFYVFEKIIFIDSFLFSARPSHFYYKALDKVSPNTRWKKFHFLQMLVDVMIYVPFYDPMLVKVVFPNQGWLRCTSLGNNCSEP